MSNLIEFWLDFTHRILYVRHPDSERTITISHPRKIQRFLRTYGLSIETMEPHKYEAEDVLGLFK